LTNGPYLFKVKTFVQTLYNIPSFLNFVNKISLLFTKKCRKQ